MILEQHIYASNRASDDAVSADMQPAFSTIDATAGLSSSDCQLLEKHSHYYLPPALLFRRETEGPAKFVYYPLDNQRSVVGRAVYLGRDSLGRPGNFVFHNYVFQSETLLAADFNPVPLVNWLENQGLFIDAIPREHLKVIDIVEALSASSNTRFEISQHDLTQILYFCHHYRNSGKPFLLLGAARRCLDFLDMLFKSLPFELRLGLSFDTCAYGTEFDSEIICLPDETQFHRPVQWALKLDLGDMQLKSGIKIKEPVKPADSVSQMLFSGMLSEVNSMYKLEYGLQRGDVNSFKKGSRSLPDNVQDFLGESNRTQIVNQLKSKHDPELLQIVINQLEPRDIEVLSANFETIRELVALGNERILGLYMLWFYKHKTRTEFYPLLFSSPVVLRTFLKWIESCYYDLTFLVECFKLLPSHYSAESEVLFLDKVMSVLSHLKTDEKLRPALFQTLKLLPEPPSESLGLVRLWLDYELSGQETLFTQLATVKLKDVPEKYRDSFKQIFLNERTRSPQEVTDKPDFLNRRDTRKGDF